MLTFQVGYAKSGRSHCKRCHDQIDDGCVRMGVTSDFTGKKQVSWYHVECLLKTNIARRCSPQGTIGFTEMDPADQDLLIRKFAALVEDEEELEVGVQPIKHFKKMCAMTINYLIQMDSGVKEEAKQEAEAEPEAPPPVIKPEAGEPTQDIKPDIKPEPGVDVKDTKDIKKVGQISERAQSYLDGLLVKSEQHKVVDDAPVVNRRRKQRRNYTRPVEINGYNNPQYAVYKRACETLVSKTFLELKEICKKNEQLVSGSKLDLVERVADGRTLGRIPKCGVCGIGVLRFNQRSGRYYCPGFMQYNVWKSCGKSYDGKDIQRLEWLE